MPGRQPGSSAEPIRVRDANGRWKSRWGAHVWRSTLAAAVVHVVILAAWPTWQITRPPIPIRSEFVQLHPIVASGAPDGSGEVPGSARDTPQPLELAPEGGGESHEEPGALEEIFGTARPEVTQPVLRGSVAGRPAAPLRSEDLVLEHLSPRSAHLAMGVAAIDLPVIRNPSTLINYLRRSANPIARDRGAGGFVSVAMWIDHTGAVEWAQVRRSSGHPALDEIALAAFDRIAIFTPARSANTRVPVLLEISIPFNLPW